MILTPTSIEQAGPGVDLKRIDDLISVTMADPDDGLAYAGNHLTLSFDLTTHENVVLKFEAMESGDEPHPPRDHEGKTPQDEEGVFGPVADFNFDGVAISDDGENWYEARGLRDLSSRGLSSIEIDLDGAIAQAGLLHSQNFKVRFCQYDNMPLRMDGIAIHAIRLTGDPLAVDPSLVLHLPMDDNAPNPIVRDKTWKHHQTFLDPGGDPKTNGHSVEGPSGPARRALAFDGVDDQINIGVDWVNEVLAAGHDFTFAVWWRNPSDDFAADRMQYVFTTGTVRVYNYLNSSAQNFTLAALLRPTGGSIYPQLIGLNDNVWHNYALLRRESTFEVWLDGVLRTTNTHADNAGDMSATAFSVSSASSSDYGPGAMADFRVYGRALSQDEIETLHQMGEV